MVSFLRRKTTVMICLLLSACGLQSRCSGPGPLEKAELDAVYIQPAPAPEGPLNVYHLGHSLVGYDMPVMLEQLAETGHSHNSQLGWGSFLKEHWDPDTPIKGFAESNNHAAYRDGHEAIASGEYDALVLTEAVELKDSIKYFTPHRYLKDWAQKARTHNPDIQVYFYETWHPLDDPEGWLFRLDRDLDLYWEGEILSRALAYEDDPQPIYMIPGGQVMAQFVRTLEGRGGIGEVKTRNDLFSDQIHFNDLGAYLMALTHYAVLYQTSPVGLPHALLKADGTPAQDPGPEVALLMQQVVWEVVTGYDKTGVRR